MAAFHLVRCAPPDYVHAQAFDEVAESLLHGITANGHTSSWAYNACRAGAINLVLGPHLLDEDAARVLPPGSVLYNLEQLHDGLLAQLPTLPWLMARYRVWDYSPRNLAYLSARGLVASWVPLGHASVLERIPSPPEQDIDILFYGSVDLTRRRHLVALSEAGLRVVHLFGRYGAERDACIARSKVVLNLHAGNNRILEMARIGYLLTNRKAVLSEWQPDTESPTGVENAIWLRRPEQLVEAACKLVTDAPLRQALGEAGRQWWQTHDIAPLLRPHLAELAGKPHQ